MHMVSMPLNLEGEIGLRTRSSKERAQHIVDPCGLTWSELYWRFHRLKANTILVYG